MFDAQKLLGHVLQGALGGGLGGSRRRRSRRSSVTGLPRGIETKVGMGLIALAVAAYEHFTQAKPAAASAPVAASAMPPPPPPGVPDAQAQSLHVLRAMIAAANADGSIDAEEREGILANARDAGLSDADVAALDSEFRTPLSLERLIAGTPADLRDEVYVAALVGMTADTDSEQRFLDQLAAGLKLDAAEQQRIRQQVGLA